MSKQDFEFLHPNVSNMCVGMFDGSVAEAGMMMLTIGVKGATSDDEVHVLGGYVGQSDNSCIWRVNDMSQTGTGEGHRYLYRREMDWSIVCSHMDFDDNIRMFRHICEVVDEYHRKDRDASPPVLLTAPEGDFMHLKMQMLTTDEWRLNKLRILANA